MPPSGYWLLSDARVVRPARTGDRIAVVHSDDTPVGVPTDRHVLRTRCCATARTLRSLAGLRLLGDTANTRSREDIGGGPATTRRAADPSYAASANLAIVRALYESFASGDAKAAFDAYAPDIEWDVSDTDWTEAGQFHGHSGVRRFWRIWLATWDEYSAEAEAFVDAGDEVLVDVTMRGVGKESGVRIKNRHAQVWTLRDGKVTRLRFYRDGREARADLGIEE